MGGGGSKPKPCNQCCELRYISQKTDVKGCNWEDRCTDVYGLAGAAERECDMRNECTDTYGLAGAAERECDMRNECTDTYGLAGAAEKPCNWEDRCTDVYGLAGAAEKPCNWEDRCTDVYGHKMRGCPAWGVDRGVFCDRQAHSIALSYPAESYRNGSVRYMDVKPKGSSVRDTKYPSCPPCQKEYAWVLGTCYEDCNITAKIASCVNGQIVKNAGKERLNYTMQGTGLCYLDCPPNTTNMSTHCALPPVTRGGGTPLECSSRWQQYGVTCYTPCNETAGISTWNGSAQVKKAGYEYMNYQMQSDGMCSQECPPGTTDGLTFCNRQKFFRAAGLEKEKKTV